LKAWSGVDTFRKASTIKFINYNFRAFLCNQRNKQGCTPLHILAQTAKSKELNFEESKRREVIIQILSWILDYDCPIDAKNTASDTALSIALKENNHELVELLLQVTLATTLTHLHFHSLAHSLTHREMLIMK
jgi:ankyrin repeat protein